MREERLLNTIGLIDDEFVCEADVPLNIKPSYVKWVSAVAGVAAVFVVGIGVWNSGIFNEAENTLEDRLFPQKTVPLATGQAGEMAVVKRWEEMTVSEKFGEFEFGGIKYSSMVSEVNAVDVGEYLGESISIGYDIYTETTYTSNVKIYSLKGISNECAVAAEFEGYEGYCVFINFDYRPETLGDFIDALNLRENISFGLVHYDWRTEDKPITHIEFTDVSEDKIWEMLLSDRTIKSVPDSPDMIYLSEISISVDIPILGYENIAIWVDEGGYLVTNILGSAKFYIGDEKKDAFIDYVMKNCTGYELIYETSEDVTFKNEDIAPEATVTQTSGGKRP